MGFNKLETNVLESAAVISTRKGVPIVEILWDVVVGCTKPFSQPRDAAQQEEGEEHADSNGKKLRLQELKKGFACSIKVDFMILRKESTIRIILVEIFMENI
jgi:hypothetical protein